MSVERRAWDRRSGERRASKRRDAVLPLTGPGTRLWVEDGMLCIRGGIADEFFDGVRERKGNPRYAPDVRLAPACHTLRAIVLTDFGYVVTSDAWEWLHREGIALSAVSLWDDVAFNLVPNAGRYGATLRRKQYAANAGVIARALIATKISRQFDLLRDVGISGDVLASLASAVDDAWNVGWENAVSDLLLMEARAASVYFRALGQWLGEIRWAGDGVPRAWRTWDGVRVSALSGRNRRATHPVNALLNFGYAVNAAQIERALAIAGFDVAAGFLHTDVDGRASLAWDALELVRVDVDRRTMEWVREGSGRKGEGKGAGKGWRRDAHFHLADSGLVLLSDTMRQSAARRLSLGRADSERVLRWVREAVE